MLNWCWHAVAVGPSALASGKKSASVGNNNNSRVRDTVTMGQDRCENNGGTAIGVQHGGLPTNGGTK